METQLTMKQGDGAGQDVSLESANREVAAFAELWGNALFDCGPQDYEFMQKEILERIKR